MYKTEKYTGNSDNPQLYEVNEDFGLPMNVLDNRLNILVNFWYIEPKLSAQLIVDLRVA